MPGICTCVNACGTCTGVACAAGLFTSTVCAVAVVGGVPVPRFDMLCRPVYIQTYKIFCLFMFCLFMFRLFAC